MSEQNQPTTPPVAEKPATQPTAPAAVKTDYLGQFIKVIKTNGPPLLKKTLSVLSSAADITAKTLGKMSDKIQVEQKNAPTSSDTAQPQEKPKDPPTAV